MKFNKLIALIALIFFIIILVLQNTETVETKILFFSFHTPRALLLFLTALIGFLLGLLVSFLVYNRKK